MATSEEQREELRKEIELRKELNRIKQADKRAIDVEIEMRNDFIKRMREENEQRELAIRAGEAGTAEREAFIETLKKQWSKTGDLTKAQEGFIESLKDTSAQLKKTQKDIENVNDAEAGISEAAAAARDLGKEFGNVAAKITGVDVNWRKSSLTGRLIDTAAKGGDVSQIMSEIGHNIAETLNPLNLFASYMAAIVDHSTQLVKNIGTASGVLRTQLGLNNDYVGSLANLTRVGLEYNMGANEARDTLTGLTETFSRFSRQTQDVQDNLGETTIVLRRLGVSAEDVGEAMDIMNKAMGVSIERTDDLIAEMAMTGRQIGVTSKTMVKDFALASRHLAAHGQNLQKEFTALAATAVQTGLSVSNLLNIAAGFDTFRDAADKVGSLNALLGGAYFDTVEMVAATEEERIRLLLEGVQATGKSFNQLGRFEQKAIANAAGITDMAEANKLFNTSLSAYDELQELAGDSTKGLNDLSEEAFNTLSWSEKFEVLLKKLTPVLDDLIKGLESFAIWLNQVVDGIREWWGEMGPLTKEFFKFLGIVLLVAPAIWAITKAFAVLKSTVMGLGGLLRLIGSGAAGAGAGAGAAAPGLAAFGVAVLKIGAGIGIAAAGIGFLAAGFSLLFKSIEKIDGTKMMQVLGFLTGIVALAALVGKFALSGVGLVALGGGFLAIAAGIGTLAAAMAFLPEDELNALASLFSSIGSLTSSAAANVTAVGAALAGLDIPESTGITKVTTLITKFSEIDPAAAASTEQILKNSMELAKLQVDEKNLQFMEKLIQLLTKLVQQSGGQGSQNTAAAIQSLVGGGQKEAIFEVDGSRLARVLIPYLDGKLVGKPRDGISGGL